MSDENKNFVSFGSNAETDLRLALLYEIGRVLASAKTMNEAAPQILETVGRHLRFELGELWCLGKDETNLKLESVWRLPSLDKIALENHDLQFSRGEGLPGKAWAKSAPVWIENLNGEDETARKFFAVETNLQSGFAFPILLDEKFVGAFSFFSTEPRRTDDALLQIFAAVGSHVGQFVKRERIESNLRASEDRYRAFIAHSTEGIWRCELDEKFSIDLPVDEQVRLAFERGYLAECNDAMARMYGLERAADLFGSRLTDLFDMADAANVEYVRAFIESGYHLTDAESHEKDARGNDKYFLNSLVGIIENGFLIRVWGTQRDVTEQKTVGWAMRESEEKFRAFVQASSQAIWTTETNGQQLEAFGWWENQTGQTREQSAGAGFLEAVHPEDRRRIGDTWQAAMRDVEAFETECRIVNRAGNYRHFAIRGVPVFDADKNFRQWIGTLTDIHERKTSESRLVLLAEISELARTIEDADELLFAVSRAVGEHFRAKRCLFNEIDLENDCETVHRDYCRGVASVAGAHRISDYSSITSDEMKAGKTVVNNDAEIDARTAENYAKIYASNGERAYVAVPLLRENRWVASLWVSDDQPRVWSEQAISLLETVAERTWTAVEKLRINEVLGESEERLRESDAILQTINQSSPTLIYLKDRAGRMINANPATLEVLGKTLSEVVGKTHGEYSGDEAEGAALAADDRRIVEGGITETFEEKVVTKGKLHTFLSTKTPYRNERGAIIGLVGVSFDITERKESEEHLQLAVDISQFSTFDIDLLTDAVETDGIGREIYGFAPDEPLTFAKVQARFHPGDKDEVLRRVGAAFAPDGSDEFEVEQRIVRTNGEIRWIRVRGRAFFSGENSERRAVRCLGTYIDITTSKRAEEDLRESRRKLETALKAGRMGSWSLDLSNGEFAASDTCKINYGRQPSDEFTYQDLADSVIPEDRERWRAVVEQAISQCAEFEVEYGVFWLDDSIHWVLVRGNCFADGAGKTNLLAGVSIDITERKAAEEKLRESEERYRSLFETMDEGFCLCEMIFDSEGKPFDYRFLEINPAFEKMTGLRNAEGKTARELIPGLEPHWFEIYGKVVTSGEQLHFEDGSEVMRRWFDVNAAPVGDANSRRFSVIFTDITSRKKIERERERFLAVGSDLQVINGVEGYFKWVNPAWERTLGWTFEEMTKTPWKEFLHPGDYEKSVKESKEAYAGKETVVFENRFRHKDGSYRWLSWSAKTYTTENLIYGVAADITERKKAEFEREELFMEAQKARKIAEDANHAKDEFIALVSHELRSPLNAMLGWTRILQNQKPDEKTREYALDVIVRNARSQSRLIEDLLDIARIGKGKLRLEMQPTELIPIVNAAVESVEPAAEAKNIAITKTLDRAADFITGDVDRLRQVIENLLSNAVKFTTDGGNVEIRLEREDRQVKLVIADTGQGISAEFLPQIFERFKQADPSATRRHGGLGIGLSLARDLIELHDGAILAASAGEGKGATFTVTLPLRVIAPIKENSGKVETMDAQGKLSGFWILAVDDEADARELVSFMLQINGAKVTTANSAVEALEILKNANGRLPDIVLSDISMPNESGYALLEKIRALPEEHGGQIPAVALTAFSRPEDREAAYEAGFQTHLGKPVEPDVLIAAIIETAGVK